MNEVIKNTHMGQPIGDNDILKQFMQLADEFEPKITSVVAFNLEYQE